MKDIRPVSLLLFLCFLLCPVPARTSLANVYIAQNSAGGNNGMDCADAYAAAFFNTATNWGSGSGQIGAGTAVHLCGTWNVAQGTTALTFYGGGAAGNPVTLLFENGTVLQSPAFLGSPSHNAHAGAIDLNGQNHLLINGGPTCGRINGSLVACNGLIQNTLNGSSGMTCPAGACSDLSDSSTAIFDAQGTATDIEIENLAIKNFYIRNNTSTADGTGTWEIYFDHRAFNGVKIHNCDIENGSETITMDFEGQSGSDLEIYNNYLSDAHWTVAITGYGNNTTFTGILIHDNEISNWSNWSIPASSYHTNGTQIYNASCTGCSIGGGGSAIYNNYVHGDLTGGQITSSPTALISLQNNAQGWNLFNNLVVNTCSTGSCGASFWFLGPNAQNISAYDNTVVDTYSKGPAAFYVGAYSGTNNITLQNNVIVNADYPIYVADNSWTELTSDYDDAYGYTKWICVNCASGPPSCLTLADYQSQHNGDVHGSNGNPLLDANYRLQAGSAAISLGANLTSLGIAALDSDAAGTPRPSSGAWDAGAFQAPTFPPTNVTATGH
jgi:hypothetical protein